MVTLPNSSFGGFHPYRDLICGDWFYNLGRDHHTGAVYLNRHWLTEAATKATVQQAAGSYPQWFAEVDGATSGSLCNVSGFRPVPGPAGGVQMNATTHSSQYGIRKGDSAAKKNEFSAGSKPTIKMLMWDLPSCQFVRSMANTQPLEGLGERARISAPMLRAGSTQPAKKRWNRR